MLVYAVYFTRFYCVLDNQLWFMTRIWEEEDCVLSKINDDDDDDE